MRDFFDVSALSFAPFAFFTGNLVGIRAAIDDARDAVAEFFADFIEAREATPVFDGVVQQCSDGFVFTAAVLNDDGGNAEQVANVRLAFALAALVQMQLRGVTESFDETVREQRLFDDGLPASQVFAYRRRALASRRRISRYNQMSVTIRPNAPYHSMYLGAPF